jgi:hypothetical protein
MFGMQITGNSPSYVNLTKSVNNGRYVFVAAVTTISVIVPQYARERRRLVVHDNFRTTLDMGTNITVNFADATYLLFDGAQSVYFERLYFYQVARSLSYGDLTTHEFRVQVTMTSLPSSLATSE